MSDDKKLTFAGFADLFRLGPEKITMTKADAVRLAETAQVASDELKRLRAELDTARCNDMGDAWIAQKHAWHEAIEDALLQRCSAPSEDETPKDALRRLIQYEITAALDPVVSQAAADLVATARREGMKDAAKWHEVRSMELSGKAGVARNFRQLLRQSDFHMESAAAIRAASGEGK